MTHSSLSEREIELLKLVATGASNKEISRRLHISINTVKVHLRNIFIKLEVSSRTEAAMWAVQNGVVDALENDDGDNLPIEGHEPRLAARDGTWKWFTQMPIRTRLLLFGAGAVLLVVLGFAASQVFQYTQGSVGGVGVSSPVEFEESHWQQLADMPTARAGLAAAAYDNQIYAIAGEGFEGILDVNESYNPSVNSWEKRAPKPLAVADVHAGVIGGRIFIPGGRFADGGSSELLEIYDPRADEWTRGASVPEKLSGYALATFEGKLYLFGGWDGRSYRNSVYIYDPDEDRWTTGTPMPTARAFAGAAEAGGKIYVIGGWDGEEAINVNEVYTPVLDRDGERPWTTGESVPGKWAETELVSVAEKIYFIGTNKDRMVTIHEFVAQNFGWQTIETTVFSHRLHFESISMGPEILLLGGIEGEKYLRQNLSYQVVYTISIPIVR
jgi:DNA-binding CsgD family transcriptional regulator